jgi:hypothetical protein
MPANTIATEEGELLELRRLFQKKKRPPSRKVPTRRKARMRVYLRVTDDLAEAIQMLKLVTGMDINTYAQSALLEAATEKLKELRHGHADDDWNSLVRTAREKAGLPAL